MLADLETEATPLRRLIAFAAVFLGMLTLANAAFARQPPLLSPPAVMGIVLFAGAGGLTVWVNGRWSRAFFWATAGLAALVGAGTGATLVAPPWGAAAAASVVLGAVAMMAGLLAAAGLVRPVDLLVRAARWGRIALGAALVLLWVIWFPVGGGPVVAFTASLYAIALAFLLRPVEEPEDDGPAEGEAGSAEPPSAGGGAASDGRGRP